MTQRATILATALSLAACGADEAPSWRSSGDVTGQSQGGVERNGASPTPPTAAPFVDVSCPEGERYDRGLDRCSALECEEGDEPFNGVCFPRCPEGETRRADNGECVPAVRGCAIPNGRGEQAWDHEALEYTSCQVQECNRHYRERFTNECVEDPCPAAYHWENEQCVPNTQVCDDQVSKREWLDFYGKWSACSPIRCNNDEVLYEGACRLEKNEPCPIPDGEGNMDWEGDGFGRCELVRCHRGRPDRDNDICVDGIEETIYLKMRAYARRSPTMAEYDAYAGLSALDAEETVLRNLSAAERAYLVDPDISYMTHHHEDAKELFFKEFEGPAPEWLLNDDELFLQRLFLTYFEVMDWHRFFSIARDWADDTFYPDSPFAPDEPVSEQEERRLLEAQFTCRQVRFQWQYRVRDEAAVCAFVAQWPACEPNHLTCP